MCAQQYSEMSAELKNKLIQVLVNNKINPEHMEQIATRDYSLGDAKGGAGVASMKNGEVFVVASMPILSLPIQGISLTQFEVMQLVLAVDAVPSASYTMDGKIVYLSLCIPIPAIKTDQIPEAIDRLMDVIIGIRTDLLGAFNHFYSIPSAKEEHYPEPNLPNIKMTPNDAKVIYGILTRCNADIQEIYNFLMEKWSKGGFFVETTPSSIVLDVPYGDRTARLGILHGSYYLSAETRWQEPILILVWDKLHSFKGFSTQAINAYQKAISGIADIRTTESSAHLSMDDHFDIQAAKKLLKAMETLAASVQPDMIEKIKPSKNSTPENIASTIETCDVHTRRIFEQIIGGWRKAGGTVQVPRAGRIYLKMKTRPHKNGIASRINHNFNLIVLAAPKGNRGPYIQVTWGLAGIKEYGYLDCIPETVKRFEVVVSVLPGFEQKGSITRLNVTESFNDEHADMLIKVMCELKLAEGEAK